MIRLSFVSGSNLRKVLIHKRSISFMSRETNFIPVAMDLDKLKVDEIKSKLGKEGLEQIEEIAKLNTEQEMADDIKKDFKETGWKLIKES